MMIGFFAGVAGTYLLEHHFWLSMIAVLGIASILVCLGGAVGIFLNRSTVGEPPTATIRENAPRSRSTSQWDYRPRKAIRAFAIMDDPGAETYEVLSPDPFAMNDNVWFNYGSVEGATPTFVDRQPDGEEFITKVVSETTDSVPAAITADDTAVSAYDQSPIDEQRAIAE